MVQITLFIGTNHVVIKLPEVSKQQAVDVIECLEIELLNLLDKTGLQFTDSDDNERFVCIDESLPANVGDSVTNEPVLFSGLLGSQFEYSIQIVNY